MASAILRVARRRRELVQCLRAFQDDVLGVALELASETLPFNLDPALTLASVAVSFSLSWK